MRVQIHFILVLRIVTLNLFDTPFLCCTTIRVLLRSGILTQTATMAKAARLLSTQSYAIWLCAVFWQVHCQILTPYQDLSPYPSYYSTGGEFTWPSGDTDIFTEGSIMTIAWDTSYSSVNLYDVYLHNISVDAVIDGKAQSQVQLASESNACETE